MYRIRNEREHELFLDYLAKLVLEVVVERAEVAEPEKQGLLEWRVLWQKAISED
jgi:hypothetical protein